MLDEIRQKDKNWKTVRVDASGLKRRILKFYQQNITLQGYKNEKRENQRLSDEYLLKTMEE